MKESAFMNEIIEQEKDFGFARVYAIELLFKEKPVVDRELLYSKIEQYMGRTDRPQNEKSGSLAVWEPYEQHEKGEMLHFFHLNYMVKHAEGELPAQTMLTGTNVGPISDYEAALQQSWHWNEAGQTLQECSHALLLVDMMASGLEPQKRLELHTNVLRAIVETVPCAAIYFRESNKLVEPSVFLAAIDEGEMLYGALNIRFYNVEGTGSERQEGLMDSIGLAALGIPDVQCHFYDMDTNEVAGCLTNFAYYLFNQGDIITDGETIGFTEEMRWRCEHQYALAVPHRIVIDLDPGEGNYAGHQGGSEK